MVLISRVRYPVLTLGHGVRAGVWTQGCTLGCQGCVAQGTWPADPETQVPVSEVVDWLAGLDRLDGVTISGGEPLDQPDGILALMQGIRRLNRPDLDILLFTGRRWRAVERAFAAVVALVDAVVAGPYEPGRPTDHPLMGSANQELVAVSPLGVERYSASSAGRTLQGSVGADGRLHLVGIPKAGDLERLEAAAARQGLTLVDRTWRNHE